MNQVTNYYKGTLLSSMRLTKRVVGGVAVFLVSLTAQAQYAEQPADYDALLGGQYVQQGQAYVSGANQCEQSGTRNCQGVLYQRFADPTISEGTGTSGADQIIVEIEARAGQAALGGLIGQTGTTIECLRTAFDGNFVSPANRCVLPGTGHPASPDIGQLTEVDNPGTASEEMPANIVVSVQTYLAHGAAIASPDTDCSVGHSHSLAGSINAVGGAGTDQVINYTYRTNYGTTAPNEQVEGEVIQWQPDEYTQVMTLTCDLPDGYESQTLGLLFQARTTHPTNDHQVRTQTFIAADAADGYVASAENNLEFFPLDGSNYISHAEVTVGGEAALVEFADDVPEGIRGSAAFWYAGLDGTTTPTDVTVTWLNDRAAWIEFQNAIYTDPNVPGTGQAQIYVVAQFTDDATQDSSATFSAYHEHASTYRAVLSGRATASDRDGSAPRISDIEVGPGTFTVDVTFDQSVSGAQPYQIADGASTALTSNHFDLTLYRPGAAESVTKLSVVVVENIDGDEASGYTKVRLHLELSTQGIELTGGEQLLVRTAKRARFSDEFITDRTIFSVDTVTRNSISDTTTQEEAASGVMHLQSAALQQVRLPIVHTLAFVENPDAASIDVDEGDSGDSEDIVATITRDNIDEASTIAVNFMVTGAASASGGRVPVRIEGQVDGPSALQAGTSTDAEIGFAVGAKTVTIRVTVDGNDDSGGDSSIVISLSADSRGAHIEVSDPRTINIGDDDHVAVTLASASSLASSVVIMETDVECDNNNPIIATIDILNNPNCPNNAIQQQFALFSAATLTLTRETGAAAGTVYNGAIITLVDQGHNSIVWAMDEGTTNNNYNIVESVDGDDLVYTINIQGSERPAHRDGTGVANLQSYLRNLELKLMPSPASAVNRADELPDASTVLYTDTSFPIRIEIKEEVNGAPFSPRSATTIPYVLQAKNDPIQVVEARVVGPNVIVSETTGHIVIAFNLVESEHGHNGGIEIPFFDGDNINGAMHISGHMLTISSSSHDVTLNPDEDTISSSDFYTTVAEGFTTTARTLDYSLEYQIEPHTSGTVEWGFTVADGVDDEIDVTVRLIVDPVNNQPSATRSTSMITIMEDIPMTVMIYERASLGEREGRPTLDQLSANIVSQPSSAGFVVSDLNIDPAGNVSATLSTAENYNDLRSDGTSITFTVTITDNYITKLTETLSTITVNVKPAPDFAELRFEPASISLKYVGMATTQTTDLQTVRLTDVDALDTNGVDSAGNSILRLTIDNVSPLDWDFDDGAVSRLNPIIRRSNSDITLTLDFPANARLRDVANAFSQVGVEYQGPVSIRGQTATLSVDYTDPDGLVASADLTLELDPKPEFSLNMQQYVRAEIRETDVEIEEEEQNSITLSSVENLITADSLDSMVHEMVVKIEGLPEDSNRWELMSTSTTFNIEKSITNNIAIFTLSANGDRTVTQVNKFMETLKIAYTNTGVDKDDNDGEFAEFAGFNSMSYPGYPGSADREIMVRITVTERYRGHEYSSEIERTVTLQAVNDDIIVDYNVEDDDEGGVRYNAATRTIEVRGNLAGEESVNIFNVDDGGERENLYISVANMDEISALNLSITVAEPVLNNGMGTVRINVSPTGELMETDDDNPASLIIAVGDGYVTPTETISLKIITDEVTTRLAVDRNVGLKVGATFMTLELDAAYDPVGAADEPPTVLEYTHNVDYTILITRQDKDKSSSAKLTVNAKDFTVVEGEAYWFPEEELSYSSAKGTIFSIDEEENLLIDEEGNPLPNKIRISLIIHRSSMDVDGNPVVLIPGDTYMVKVTIDDSAENALAHAERAREEAEVKARAEGANREEQIEAGEDAAQDVIEKYYAYEIASDTMARLGGEDGKTILATAELASLSSTTDSITDHCGGPGHEDSDGDGVRNDYELEIGSDCSGTDVNDYIGDEGPEPITGDEYIVVIEDSGDLSAFRSVSGGPTKVIPHSPIGQTTVTSLNTEYTSAAKCPDGVDNCMLTAFVRSSPTTTYTEDTNFSGDDTCRLTTDDEMCKQDDEDKGKLGYQVVLPLGYSVIEWQAQDDFGNRVYAREKVYVAPVAVLNGVTDVFMSEASSITVVLQYAYTYRDVINAYRDKFDGAALELQNANSVTIYRDSKPLVNLRADEVTSFARINQISPSSFIGTWYEIELGIYSSGEMDSITFNFPDASDFIRDTEFGDLPSPAAYHLANQLTLNSLDAVAVAEEVAEIHIGGITVVPAGTVVPADNTNFSYKSMTYLDDYDIRVDGGILSEEMTTLTETITITLQLEQGTTSQDVPSTVVEFDRGERINVISATISIANMFTDINDPDDIDYVTIAAKWRTADVVALDEALVADGEEPTPCTDKGIADKGIVCSETRYEIASTITDANIDSDNDGISDEFDAEPTKLVAQISGGVPNRSIEVETGYELALGNDARIDDGNDEKVAQLSTSATQTLDDIETLLNYVPAQGIYDFVVYLPGDTNNVYVSIPLGAPLEKGQSYVKYKNGSWVAFNRDNDNALYSALGFVRGDTLTCPDPAPSPAWTKANDDGILIEGDQCILLEITDGDSNDDDGDLNGIIVDPGTPGNVRRGGGSSGGGAADLWLLLMLLMSISIMPLVTQVRSRLGRNPS